MYSVYGSPDINYSAFYEKEPPKGLQDILSQQFKTTRDSKSQKKDKDLELDLAFLKSALGSRSADVEDHPVNKKKNNKKRKSTGGGIQ